MSNRLYLRMAGRFLCQVIILNYFSPLIIFVLNTLKKINLCSKGGLLVCVAR